MGPDSPCPDDNSLAAFAQGVIERARQAELATHVGGCEACSDIVAELTETHASTPAARAPQLLQPGARLGRYEILGIVGAGNVGVVYRARDPNLQREVAVKVVAVDGGAKVREQAVREARALARLAHPNVLTVLDVGTTDAVLWIATELVDGPSLDVWLAETTRSQTEIVGAFSEVCEALTAVHAAQFVHRDVKPANIFVGTDGRTRLGDFGLASLGQAPPTDPAGLSQLPLTGLTQTGAIIGTPRFMAPEQLQGKPVDGSADQFALCVALYHALFGRYPFDGTDFLTVRDNVIAGRVHLPPAGHAVPTYVRDAILKGLAVAPADRHASVGALQYALTRPRRPRWWILGLLGLVGGAVFVAWPSQPPDICTDSSDAIAVAWSPTQRNAIAKTFEASAVPYAASALASTTDAFDGFATAWTGAVDRACAAPGEARKFDATVACLVRQRAEARSLSQLLANADVALISNAATTVGKLPLPSRCDSADLLPEDPATRMAVAEATEALAELAALSHAGSYRDGLAKAEALAAGVTDLQHAATRAEALLMLASFHRELGHAEAAERWYRDAALAGESADRADLAAKAMAGVVYTVGAQQHRYEDAEIAVRHAQAMVTRAGHPIPLRAKLQDAIGAMELRRGRYDNARAAYAEALELRALEHGDGSLPHGNGLTNLGAVAAQSGDLELAATQFEGALAIYEDHLGPVHPSIAKTLTNLGAVYRGQRRYADARAALSRALAVREQTVGPLHPHTAAVLGNLGNVHLSEKDYPRAVKLFERANAIYEQDAEGNREFIAGTTDSLGAALSYLGEHERAIAALNRALQLHMELLGEEHVQVARSQNNLANVLLADGQSARAVELAGSAAATMNLALGEEHPTVARVLITLGRAQLADGSHEAAKTSFERARTILSRSKANATSHGNALMGLGRVAVAGAQWAKAANDFTRAAELYADSDSGSQADAIFESAKALAEVPNEHGRALAEAKRARGLLVTQQPVDDEALAELDAWVAAAK